MGLKMEIMENETFKINGLTVELVRYSYTKDYKIYLE